MSESNAAPLIAGRTLVHVGVFAVLLAVTLVSSGKPDRAGIRELKLPDFDKDTISSFEVSGKNKAKLTREGTAWQVEDPANAGKKFLVEQATVDRALEAIADLETGAFVTGRADKHSELEIDAEKGTVLTVTGGKKTMTIVIGRFAKGGGNYVRQQGSDEVFVGKGSLGAAVGKEAKAWRRKKIIEVEEKDLTELLVTLPGQAPYRLVRGPSEGEGAEAQPGDWKLANAGTLPEGFRLDTAALKRIATSFANLRAADFVDEAVTDAGLDAGAVTVGAKTSDGKALTVSFGKADDKKRVYTRVSGDPQLYVVNEYNKKNTAKALLDLRDMTLLPGLDAGKISQVEIDGPEGKMLLKKEADAWVLAAGTAPADKPFDATTVQSKLGQLGRLKGSAFLGKDAAFKAAKPPVQMTLTIDGETAPRTLSFSELLPAKGDKPSNQVAVKVSDGFVYEIGKYQKDRYAKPWDLFKKVAPPPGGGGGGGIPGMENLPPDIRKQLEAQLKAGKFPGGN